MRYKKKIRPKRRKDQIDLKKNHEEDGYRSDLLHDLYHDNDKFKSTS